MATILPSSPTSSFLSSSNPTNFRPTSARSPGQSTPAHSPRPNITAFQTGSDRNHTHYQVLEIPQSASASDIKMAYRRMARRFHPDVVPAHEKAATTEQFLRIHAAYTLLSDADARAEYDHKLRLAASSIWPQSSASTSTIWASPPKATSSSSFSFTSRGRSWESDQCWC